MDRLHFRLLIVLFHCLVVSGTYCDLTTQYYNTYELIYVYTCFNVKIFQVYQEIRNRGPYTNIVIKNSSISTLSQSENSWNNIQKLRIEETNTHKIIPGFFNNFNDLTELCITKNQITTISDGVFSSIYKLYTLNLTENLIETITQHSFSGLFNLRELDLSKNKITSLPEDVFADQKYLSYVDISNNMLKSVGTIFNKPSLITINVSRNFLSEFDYNQLQNSNISEIDLSHNLFDNFTDVDNVIHIDNISLAYNNIGVLPKINNIKRLNISHNRIQGINEIRLSKTLQSLDVTGNNISVLTNHIFTNLTDLTYLYFADNNLSILQVDALHNLHNLTHLDLSFNRIRQIPFGFFNDLRKLTYLDLSDNNMVLDFHTLSTLELLKTIKFANIKVQNFDSDILLSRFQFLHSITLSDNSWNCSELASIIHKLQLNNRNITPGQNRNVSNILGISCKDNTDLKEDTIIIERNNEASKDVEIYPSAEKIDNILDKTSFLKYLRTIAEHISSDNKSMTNYVGYQHENLTNTNKLIENTSNQLTDMQEYMRKILNNTNYFKEYLNSSRSTETDAEYLGKVKQVNGLNGWSEINQTLINFTNSFNKISNNMEQVLSSDSVPVGQNIESKALISEKHGESQTNNNGEIISNIFLAMILCCLLFSAYRNFFKPKIMNNTVQEQVQLM